jgi:hypothetical protein
MFEHIPHLILPPRNLLLTKGVASQHLTIKYLDALVLSGKNEGDGKFIYLMSNVETRPPWVGMRIALMRVMSFVVCADSGRNSLCLSLSVKLFYIRSKYDTHINS